MFKVGDKVVLINDNPTINGNTPGKIGDIFTVLQIQSDGGSQQYLQIDGNRGGASWRASRFKLYEKYNNIVEMILSGELNDGLP